MALAHTNSMLVCMHKIWALSEDLVPTGILQVRRDSQAVGLFSRVELTWEALYADGGTHPVSLDTILVNPRGTLVFAAGQIIPETELTLQLNPNSVCSVDIINMHGCMPSNNWVIPHVT